MDQCFCLCAAQSLFEIAIAIGKFPRATIGVASEGNAGKEGMLDVAGCFSGEEDLGNVRARRLEVSECATSICLDTATDGVSAACVRFSGVVINANCSD